MRERERERKRLTREGTVEVGGLWRASRPGELNPRVLSREEVKAWILNRIIES